MTLYERRKDYLLKKLLKEYEILYNKVRFILAVNDGTVKVQKVKRANIIKQLKDQGFKKWSELCKILDESQSALLNQGE